MLVEDPHDLPRVHGGAAAQGDDHIRLEGRHGLGALLRVGQSGVGLDIGEYGVDNAHGGELVGNGLGVAVLEEEGVGDDKRPLLAQHIPQLIQCHREAALLEIDLLGGAEPQHILSPLRHGLDVQKVHGPHVLADAVAAPRAAAQGQGGAQLEIVEIADAAMAGGGIYHYPAGLHGGAEGVEAVGSVGVDVNRGGVAIAAVGHQALRLGDGLLKGLGPVHSQHRRQFLMGEGLRGLHALHLADEDLDSRVHGDAGHLRNLSGALAHDLGIEGAVNEDGFAELLDLILL